MLSLLYRYFNKTRIAPAIPAENPTNSSLPSPLLSLKNHHPTRIGIIVTETPWIGRTRLAGPPSLKAQKSAKRAPITAKERENTGKAIFFSSRGKPFLSIFKIAMEARKDPENHPIRNVPCEAVEEKTFKRKMAVP